jgi:hypothetical protein
VAALFVLVTVFSLLLSAQAQSRISFSSSDRFSILELNGSIRFAYNGSYSSAELQNDTWVFRDLAINSSRLLGTLKVSAQNSNISIYSFYSSDAISVTRQNVRYYAEGVGSQVFNLGVNGTTHPSEWWVTINAPNSVFLAQGREWRLLSDNTVIVNGQTGNISVSHSNFNIGPDYSKMPFVERHFVLIATFAAVAVTVVIAFIITFGVRRKPYGN